MSCYFDDLCSQFRGNDDMVTLKSFLRRFNYISVVVTKPGMMAEYERTEMLLCMLPK